ncbi:MAG: hypothetical protein R3F42_05510 [Pseudomonadota bacterium]
MPAATRTPGISRSERLSSAGLERLERQLARGGQISDAVLSQWIRRYGDAARAIIARYGRMPGTDGN